MSRRSVLLLAGLVVALLGSWMQPAAADQVDTAGVVWALPGSPAQQPPEDPPVEVEPPCLPVDPLCGIGEGFEWLGDQVGEVITDVWIMAMTALWEAGLWVLGLAFGVIDAFTTPDLSADGPMSQVYPFTFGIGAALAVLMALIQVGVAAFRRDGKSLGRVAIGLCQFGLVWAGYVGIAVLLVTGVAGLTEGLLQGLLGIDNLASFETSVSGPREVTDATVATVLGLCTIFLLFPAAAAYLLLMLVRMAALMLLAATSAIAAGGLLAETSSAWFWKSLRWFMAALLISPLAVLILGIGVQITEGVVSGYGDDTEAAVGMAVVGCLLILIGAIAPLTLFKLLAFVDPGTSSGIAMRQSLAASGGVLGLLGGSSAGSAAASAAGGRSGSGAAAKVQDGRAAGESSAEGSTHGRFAGAVRALASGSAKAGAIAGHVVASGSDVLGAGGVGHQAPYYGQPSTGGATPGGGSSSPPADKQSPPARPSAPDSHGPTPTPQSPPPAGPPPQRVPPQPGGSRPAPSRPVWAAPQPSPNRPAPVPALHP